jgi:hypothetical protein
VLELPGRDLSLLGPREQAAILERWGLLLASCCRERSPLRRLQLLTRVLPLPNDAHLEHLEARGDRSSPFYQAYHAEHLEQAWLPAHLHLLVVQVSLGRGHRLAKNRDGGDEEGTAVLGGEVEQLCAQLGEILPGETHPVSPKRLAWLLRTAFDPLTVDLGESPITLAQVAPGPQHESLTRYRCGDSWHATLRVAEWPRREVGPDFQLPLLLEAKACRAYSIVLAPVAPSRSARAAARSRALELSDLSVRQRHGFLDSSRRVQERAATERRERELALGHQEYRFAGYITVSAPSLEELESAVLEVEARARQCQMRLSPMLGEQRAGFGYTLPLACGLSDSRL